MSINNIIGGMDDLQENQDGTLKGGYLSITGGRYRVIIDNNNVDPAEAPNRECRNTGSMSCANHNAACTNDYCDHSKNDAIVAGPGKPFNCSNDTCRTVTGISNSTSNLNISND